MGTGPYQLESWYPGKVLRLKANNNYFRGKPAIEKVQVFPYPDDKLRALAILSNYVALATRIPATEVFHIKANENLTFSTRPVL